MRIRFLGIALVLFATLLANFSAHAQSETDRLRDALRGATAQARALEDQRTALQAKLADAERDKAAAKAEIDAAKAEVKKVEKEQRAAVEEFNQRLTDRDQALEKWKSAYEEAANVARAKDAERAKFEGEATAYKASTKSCVARNGELIKAGREILTRYRAVTIGDIIVAREPVLGQRRVEIQNWLQDSNDKLLDQKAIP
jgi:chromosome segregation ATPase